MYVNDFGQTISADLVIIHTTAEQLTELSNVVLNRLTQSSTPHIQFDVMESEHLSLEAEIHDLEGDALEKYKVVLPSATYIDEPSTIAMRFIRFIFGDPAEIQSIDEDGQISISLPFNIYISSTHGL